MEPFLAQIIMFGGNFAPRGWALCDGQLLPINANQALFSLLGTTYGGDGRTTFALPDLRGRSPIHAGTGPGLSTMKLGQRGGAEYVTLNITQMPSHNHSGSAKVLGADPVARGTDSTSPTNAFPAEGGVYGTVANVEMGAGTVTINNNGGNQPFYNRNPFEVVNYIIALQGTFPSRS